ncbi:MAG: hypothetical protein JKY08_07690 [Flavobacteriaceae bacterium]|nr:hypothetical protein [Flavobacteriaceae bacterium]
MTIFNTDDLTDLPPELIKELRLVGEVDTKLLSLFNEAGGTLNLSTLLVGYYRKYKESKTRQYMMTTCYRLVKKGLLSPTDRKGEYNITDRGNSVIGNKDDDEVKNDQ